MCVYVCVCRYITKGKKRLSTKFVGTQSFK